MKPIMQLLLVVITIFLLYSPAAADEKVVSDLLRKESLEFAPEKNVVLTMLKAREPEGSGVLNGSFGEQEINVRIDKTIKTYYLTEMLTKGYRSGKKVEALISKEHQWYIPVENQDMKSIGAAVVRKGITVEEAKKGRQRRSWSLIIWIMEYQSRKESFEYVKRLEGKWHVGMVVMSPLKELDFISDKRRIAKCLKEAGIDSPNAIKYIKSVGRFTDILYIRQGNEEYGIPLGGRPDFTGLQNGKVYKLSEIVDVLEKTTESEPYMYKKSWVEILFEYDMLLIIFLLAGLITIVKNSKKAGT